MENIVVALLNKKHCTTYARLFKLLLSFVPMKEERINILLLNGKWSF
jgi:hypothetical protein